MTNSPLTRAREDQTLPFRESHSRTLGKAVVGVRVAVFAAHRLVNLRATTWA